MPPRTRLLLPVGALLGALGWWLPWLGARSGAAGLVLLGLDLGEFLRFTNAWSARLISVERESFFLPPVLAALLLALALARASWRARALAALPLLWLTFVILPEFEIVWPLVNDLPAALGDEARMTEFGGRLALGLGGALALVALLAAGHRLPVRARGALALAVALLGLVPLWALWRVWPVVQGLYGGGATLGPGTAVSALGFVLAALAACRALLFSRE